MEEYGLSGNCRWLGESRVQRVRGCSRAGWRAGMGEAWRCFSVTSLRGLVFTFRTVGMLLKALKQEWSPTDVHF